MNSSGSEEDDPVEFLRARRQASLPACAEPEPVPAEPEPEPQPSPLGLINPDTALEPEIVPAVVLTQDSHARDVPSWLASLPDGKVGPSGKVDFAYHSLDDSSIVRALHWLLAQRKFVRSLHLQCNSITVLSDWVGQLTRIEELHLSHNRLKSLPSSLGRLVDLKILCLDHNRLIGLPECLRLLDNLEVIEVESNPLVSPPIEVCRDGIHSIKCFFGRQIEARQRLAFVCASHVRLGMCSPARPGNLCPTLLDYLGRSGVLQSSAFLRWQRGVAQRIEEETGQRRTDAAEVQESRQHLLTVEAAGWLTKQGKVVKNWKSRWFTLSRGQLCYYEAVNAVSLEHVLAHKRHSLSITGESSARGTIDLLQVYHIQGIPECSDTDGRPTIELSTVDRVYLLRCDSEDAMCKWVTVLREALHAVVVLGEHELLDLRCKDISAAATNIRPEARTLHYIVDVDELAEKGLGSVNTGGDPRADQGSGGKQPWASAKQKVRQTMDWSKIGSNARRTARSDDATVNHSVKLQASATSNSRGANNITVAGSTSMLTAVPGVAAEAVAATAKTGISMFVGALGAVPESESPEPVDIEVRIQRAGSVGVVVDQTELAMGSDAMQEGLAQAWRNMH